jgi:hypothetical protein
MLLMMGFALFFTTYEVYAYFLGGIDGLPPLPECYWPSDEPLPPLDFAAGRTREEDKRLAQAFGEDCDEIKYRTIKLVLKDRGLVLATTDFTIEQDGRVKLKPFSVAIFGKERPDSHYPEINTVRANEAYLKFDRPISNQTEIGNRKIIGGELRGTIVINNNRGTAQKNDDIQLTVCGKPMFYDELKHKVWTEGAVKLLDTLSRPNPTEITAMGMQLDLTMATPAARKAGKKPKTETISGVERVHLNQNVKMHLYVDAHSGFLGNGHGKEGEGEVGKTPPSPKKPAKSAGPGKAPEGDKAHVVIDTDGPFLYDIPKDLATFDIPPRTAGNPGGLDPPQVLVFREHDPGHGLGRKYDQLVCDHLEIQFRRKPDPGPRAPRDNRSGDRDIESAHAVAYVTADKDSEVVLTLDTEELEVHGQDLVYHCPTPARGPETTIKGGKDRDGKYKPLLAIKQRNVIQARELWLAGAVQKGSPQQAIAKGPGRIDLADRNSDSAKPRHPFHIFWKDLLVSTKDTNRDGTFDLMTLTGDAAFKDDDHNQELHGERLQVWLWPTDHNNPPAGSAAAPAQATPAGVDTARQRPYRLEAYEHVSALSPEMNILETEHLTVWFHDAPGNTGELPAPAADPQAPARDRSAARPANSGGAPPEDPAGTGTARPGTDPSKPAKKPLNLRARSVVAHVLRTGPKNELQQMLTEGKVHVHQEGSTPQDKGVDIKGETLHLDRYPRGDLLVVLGNSKRLAELQLGELYLLGPKVTIDQRENTAEVKGVGVMDMPSNTTFEGGRPAKPGTRLRIHWTTGMLFNGKDADFHGGVQAEQDNSRMLCQTLQATLDRVVSLKQGQKEGQAARVEKLVCDRKVNVEERVLQDGKLQKYSRIICQQLAVDNQQGPIIATGPGVVTLWQPGAVDNTLPGPERSPRPTPASKPKEEMKRTTIEFDGRMFSNNKNSIRTAIFYDKIEVCNSPADSPESRFDKDRIPERGMFMSCEKLTVFTTPQADGKSTQTLIAEKQVFVKTPEFLARAARVTYDEAKDLVIFEAGGGALASFYKLKEAGKEPQEFKGQKIYYRRLTKEFKLEDGGSIMILD